MTDARRRRQARKKDPFADALPAPLRRPTGCLDRCPDCRIRCSGHVDPFAPDEHFFGCEHHR